MYNCKIKKLKKHNLILPIIKSLQLCKINILKSIKLPKLLVVLVINYNKI
jgi:hypothetical protein